MSKFTWSVIILFLVSGDAACTAEGVKLPGPDELKVKSDHPRIWLTPELLLELRAEAKAGHPYWTLLKEKCDGLLETKDLNVGYGAEALALAYQLTGDRKYGDAAVTLMMDYFDWLERGFRFESNEANRNNGDYWAETDWGSHKQAFLALAYDWAYDRMSDTQKKRAVEMFNKSIHSGMGEKGQGGDLTGPGTSWSDSNNHTHTKMRFLSFVGFATFGDNPQAMDLVRRTYVYVTQRMLPLYNRYFAGGYTYGGFNYGIHRSFNYYLFYQSALKTAAGVDLSAQARFPEDFIYFAIHARYPNETTSYTHGRGSWSRSFGDNMRAFEICCFLSDLYGGKISGRLLEGMPIPAPKLGYGDPIHQVIFRRRNVQPIDFRKTLDPGYFAPGMGVMFARTDWSIDATWVSAVFGAYIGDHQSYDTMGHFTLWRGEPLIPPNHGANVLHIGKFDMRPKGSLFYFYRDAKSVPFEGHPVAYRNADRYSYVAGDVTDCYFAETMKGVAGKTIRECKDIEIDSSRVYRQVLFIRPDVLVLFDRTGTLKDSVATSWHCTFRGEVNVAADGFTVSGKEGKGALTGKVLLPKKATLSATPGKDSTLLVVKPAAPMKDEIYLVVMETFAGGKAKDFPCEPVEEYGNLGAAFTLSPSALSSGPKGTGEKAKVLFAKSGSPAGTIDISGQASALPDKIEFDIEKLRSGK